MVKSENAHESSLSFNPIMIKINLVCVKTSRYFQYNNTSSFNYQTLIKETFTAEIMEERKKETCLSFFEILGSFMKFFGQTAVDSEPKADTWLLATLQSCV